MPNFKPGEDVDDNNPLPVVIADGMSTAYSAIDAIGYQQLTSVQLQQVQHLSPPAGAMRAYVQNNGGSNVRWRDDGTAPTVSIGMRIENGDDHTFTGDLTLPAFKDEGANAVLDISYYG